MTTTPLPVVRRRRFPLWIFAIIVMYHLLVGTVVAGPIAWAWLEDAAYDPFIACFVASTVILLSIGLGLIIIPVGSVRQPRAERRPLWIPLLSSATLAMVVFGGLSIASHEFAYSSSNSKEAENALLLILFALPVVWIFWAIFFSMLALGTDRDRWNQRLYRTLIAGSVLELLIVVPMHIVVRRRGECCGGMATGLGIGIGVVVMVIAIGPAVLIFCHRKIMERNAKQSRIEPVS